MKYLYLMICQKRRNVTKKTNEHPELKRCAKILIIRVILCKMFQTVSY
jgi:hypothetical protein